VGNVHTGCCLTIKESIASTIYYWGSTEVVENPLPLRLALSKTGLTTSKERNTMLMIWAFILVKCK
jgi:hypothetical protein